MIHSLTTLDLVRAILILTLAYLAYVDLCTFRLPDLITIPMLFTGLFFNFFANLGLTNFLNALAGAGFGYIFLWGLNFVYKRIKKQNGIGMGDAKLLSALGAWLGLNALPNILFLASISGLLGGVIWLQLQKRSIHSAFPFGPFLAIAGIIELLWPQLLPLLINPA